MNKSRHILITVLLSICLAGGIQAQNANEILAFHLDALGGQKNVEDIYSVQGYASAEYLGTPAKLKVFNKFPYRALIQYEIGSASITLLTDGIQGWTTDINGSTRINSPEELKSYLNDAYINTYSYLLPNRNPGQNDYRGDTLINGKNYHQFALFPERGDSTFIFINVSSGLIDYRVEISSGLKMRTSYTDYRVVNNVLIPFESTTEGIGTSFQVSSRLDSIFFNIEIPDSIFVNPSERENLFNFGNGKKYAEVPFSINRGHITFQARVNGQGPFHFMLDSGAGSSLLSPGMINALDLKPFGALPARGVGGLNSIKIVEIDSISIGNLTLAYNRIGVISSDSRTNRILGEFDGILGYDFISRFPIRIDFDRSLITVFHKDFTPPNPNGIPVSLEIQFQLPLIDVEVNGVKTRTVIDIGAQVEYALREKSMAYLSLKDIFDSSNQISKIIGIGGVERVKIVKLDSIKIDKLIINNPRILLFETGTTFPMQEYIEGLIGLELLDEFNIFVDYSRGKIYFERRSGLEN